ncbi:unnamed protein product [Diamesa serratosioi]
MNSDLNVNKRNRFQKTEILKTPIKSPEDKKDYKLVKLSNGITALLIKHVVDESEIDNNKEEKTNGEELSGEEASCTETESEDESSDDESEEAPREKLAAVALSINVGSFNDPREVQGLSHFLEHMIFMGSKKYPLENELDEFITKNGGNSNAWTENEYTAFYFEIVEKSLVQAIDIFSQLFISPLILKNSMQKEIEAVESEFQNTINDDGTRIYQLLASLADESHPASTFSWGNLRSLQTDEDNDKLNNKLHEFRKLHYVAEKIYLCIESRLELDELQEIVESHFSEIKRSNEIVKKESSPTDDWKNVFKTNFYDNIFYVKPKADKCKMFLSFPMQSLQKEYRSKPHDYLGSLIEDEGVGSLSSYLRKNLWAVQVEAGSNDKSFEGNSLFTLFSITVTLTESGYENISSILEAIFSYLLLLKKTSIGVHKKLFAEYKQIKDTAFKYQEEKTAVDNVEECVVNMQYYNSEDILTGSEIYFEFSEQLVMDMIDKLNERKFNLMILTDKFSTFDKIEKWFGTDYAELKFPDEYKKLWDEREIQTQFKVPIPNEFICTDFQIHSMKTDDNTKKQKYPVVIFKNEYCECYFKLDETFKLPYGYIYVYFISPLPVHSVVNYNLTECYAMIVKHYLAERLYPAAVAGLGCVIYPVEKGLVLKLTGFNEKIPLLIDMITKEFKKIPGMLERSVFETYKKQFKKSCFNKMISSKELNRDCRINIVERNHQTFYSRYLAVDDLTFEELQIYSEKFFDKLNIQSLIQGNFKHSEAGQMIKHVINNLKCNAIEKESDVESRAHQLPKGSNTLRIKSMLLNDINSTVTNFYQLGESSVRKQCIIEFLVKLMEEPLFNILRTQEQLGYSVDCSERDNCGILGITITIQSQENKNPATAVEKRIDNFLMSDVKDLVEGLTDEHFTVVQETLIKLKSIVDIDLESEVNRYWGEIVSKDYLFNRLELEAQMLTTITKKDVIEFYKTNVNLMNRRKLSVQVVGSIIEEKSDQSTVPELQSIPNIPGTEINTIKDMNTFRDSLFLYPVTQTKF